MTTTDKCSTDGHDYDPRSGFCVRCDSYDYDPYRDSLALGRRPDGTFGPMTCKAEGCTGIVRSWSHEGLCKAHHLDLWAYRSIVEELTL